MNPYQVDGSPGYNSRQMDESVGERPEKLTRVRLVQFHKHPNEPMVSHAVLSCRQFGVFQHILLQKKCCDRAQAEKHIEEQYSRNSVSRVILNSALTLLQGAP